MSHDEYARRIRFAESDPEAAAAENRSSPVPMPTHGEMLGRRLSLHLPSEYVAASNEHSPSSGSPAQPKHGAELAIDMDSALHVGLETARDRGDAELAMAAAARAARAAPWWTAAQVR
jgi:hypothetical protein